MTLPRMLDGRGFGNLCKLRDKGIYGREIPLATIVGDDGIAPVKWLRKKLVGRDSVEPRDGASTARQSLALPFTKLLFDELVIPLIPSLTGGKIADIVTRRETIYARIDFSEVPISAVVDSRGCALLDPPEREGIPLVCRACSELEHDLTTVITNSPGLRLATTWSRHAKMEHRRGAAPFFPSSRPAKVSPSRPRSKTKPIRSTISFSIWPTSGPVRVSPAKKLCSVAGLGFSASGFTAAPIIPVTSKWECPSITAPAPRK